MNFVKTLIDMTAIALFFISSLMLKLAMAGVRSGGAAARLAEPSSIEIAIETH